MAPMNEKLEKLRASADRLNAKTDGLNKIIEDLDEQLDDLHLGVVTWLDEFRYRVHQSARWTDDNDLVRSTAWCIGYAKVDERWTLAAKKIEIVRRFDDDSREEYDDVTDAAPAVALQKAPRIVRVEAAKHLEALIEALDERALAFVANIEKAEKLVRQ